MYKLLLCWRYLRTRFLAMVCIVSVMLGVGTLIVVNSVMSGFSTKLRDRLHGLLSDIVVEAWDAEGFADPRHKMELIRRDPFLKEQIVAMTPTLEIFGMLQFRWQDRPIMRLVRLIGIEPEGRAMVGGFAEHLQDEERRKKPSFELGKEAAQRQQRHQQAKQAMQENPFPELTHPPEMPFLPKELQPDKRLPPKPPPLPPPDNPFAPQGAIVGWAIAHFRDPEAHADQANKDITTLECGDEVVITTVSGIRMTPVYDRFAVVDYFKSEMSEYDSQYVFVPLEHLQKLRTMEDRATSIQIRLKDYGHAKEVVEHLKAVFNGYPVTVETWEKKQGPLLAAVSVEKGILNVLLFLIIAVAGFGILAIFSMIVVEKTRDIGVLKALGASNTGVLNIFLGYGLLLGVVGAFLGTTLGLTLTVFINQIEQGLAHLTGQDIFPRSVYYFDKIPTDIQPLTVLLVNVGAVGIAVLFSILPALRAALLHPVRALRYE